MFQKEKWIFSERDWCPPLIARWAYLISICPRIPKRAQTNLKQLFRIYVAKIFAENISELRNPFQLIIGALNEVIKGLAWKTGKAILNPQAPVSQKIADEVVFSTFPRWTSRVFLNRTSPTQILFFSWFYIKIMFWVWWFYSLFERMRLESKKWCLFTLTNL